MRREERDDVANLVFPTFLKDALSFSLLDLSLAKNLTISFSCGPGAFALPDEAAAVHLSLDRNSKKAG